MLATRTKLLTSSSRRTIHTRKFKNDTSILPTVGLWTSIMFVFASVSHQTSKHIKDAKSSP